MKKTLYRGASLLAGLSLLAAATPALAHQAGDQDPVDPNCMGKLTSLHAKDAQGIKNSAEKYRHTGIGGSSTGSVQVHQKLFQSYCKSE